MKFIGARQELKLFQQHASIYAERAPQQQQQQQQDDEEDSKVSEHKRVYMDFLGDIEIFCCVEIFIPF
jgi:hypothetical protein